MSAKKSREGLSPPARPPCTSAAARSAWPTGRPPACRWWASRSTRCSAASCCRKRSIRPGGAGHLHLRPWLPVEQPAYRPARPGLVAAGREHAPGTERRRLRAGRRPRPPDRLSRAGSRRTALFRQRGAVAAPRRFERRRSAGLARALGGGAGRTADAGGLGAGAVRPQLPAFPALPRRYLAPAGQLRPRRLPHRVPLERTWPAHRRARQRRAQLRAGLPAGLRAERGRRRPASVRRDPGQPRRTAAGLHRSAEPGARLAGALPIQRQRRSDRRARPSWPGGPGIRLARAHAGRPRRTGRAGGSLRVGCPCSARAGREADRGGRPDPYLPLPARCHRGQRQPRPRRTLRVRRRGWAAALDRTGQDRRQP
ncbi:Uncharacterised protein [Pseudomonas aeruginosa]|nr:Uncharacterised protein [Pseudomonas aeruginosa]